MADVNERVAIERWCEDAGWVRRLARELVVDATLADDLAQDAWLRAVRGPRPAPGAFRSWVATVLRNLARSERRSRGRRTLHEAAALDERVGEDPAEVAARLEICRDLVDAVRGLDEPYRTAITLRYLEGASPAGIAARTGVPRRTVHTHLRRGLQQLRARLDARHGGRSGWLGVMTALVAEPAPAAQVAAIMGSKAHVGVGAATLVAVLAWFGGAALVDPEHPEPRRAEPAAAGPVGASITEPTAAGAQPAPAMAPRFAVPEIASAESADAGPFVLRGKVVDTAAQPVGNVRVGFTPFGAQQAIASIAADAGGAFVLEMEGPSGGKLGVESADWGVVYEPVLWGGRMDEELTIVVARCRPVRGVVVDERGTPIPGAEVKAHVALPARSLFGRSLERSLDATWDAVTGTDGRFTLPRVPTLGGARLATHASGYRPDERAIEPVAGEHTITLVSADTLLSGVVVDREGRPVPGAVVFCGATGANTDDEGRFTIDLGRVGEDGARATHRWLIAARAGNLPARVRCPGDDWQHAASWPRPLVLRFEADALAITGTVVEVDGTPAPQVRVEVLDCEPTGDANEAAAVNRFRTIEFLARVHVRATADGAEFWEAGQPAPPGGFVVGGLQDKAYRLRIVDPEALFTHVTAPILAGRHDVVVRLPARAPWPEIAGTVRDRRGDPVAGASVRFVCERAEEALKTAALTTDEAGWFRYEGLSRAAGTVLVQGPGIARPTRFSLEDVMRSTPLVLTIPVKARARIAPTPTSRLGRQVAFLNGRGERVAVTITHGNMAWGQTEVALADGGSETFAVPDDAVVAVLLGDEGEIARRAVDLGPGDVQAVRF